LDILRAFQKNKFHCEFYPDLEKVADIVPLYLSTRCPFEEKYEMGSTENAPMYPPRRILLSPLEVLTF